jgi:hypothetical protein
VSGAGTEVSIADSWLRTIWTLRQASLADLTLLGAPCSSGAMASFRADWKVASATTNDRRFRSAASGENSPGFRITPPRPRRAFFPRLLVMHASGERKQAGRLPARPIAAGVYTFPITHRGVFGGSAEYPAAGGQMQANSRRALPLPADPLQRPGRGRLAPLWAGGKGLASRRRASLPFAFSPPVPRRGEATPTSTLPPRAGTSTTRWKGPRADPATSARGHPRWPRPVRDRASGDRRRMPR